MNKWDGAGHLVILIAINSLESVMLSEKRKTQKSSADIWVLKLIKWWRRGELNPRPQAIHDKALHT